MRRLAILTLILTTACAPALTPAPATHVPTLPLPATLAPAAPSPATAAPETEPAPTVQPGGVTDFPNPDLYQWETVADGLERPVDIQNAGDGSGRLFIVEQPGVIRTLANGRLVAEPFLDIRDRVDDSDNEQGLLGLAFHPLFKENGVFYVNYTKRGGDTVIARFHASLDQNADPNSEARLLTVKQPFGNHNGGGLAFGPDGYLYIALGDGGSGGDPYGNGQSLKTLLGKILRIDVDNGDPYAIPADNPFGNEIFHYGLRNPWRFSFDPLTHDLWIGDVGQGEWEEIDFLPAGTPGGVNFGWNRFEGMHDYTAGAIPENYRSPLFEYSHNEGCSVTGGYVYRGAMREWQGVYFYGDFCSGKVWGALRTVGAAEEISTSTVLFETGAQITSFGVDETGELYIAAMNGSILRLARR
ncbi:MAG: PQQ-dependent sugar dehydrogenase [Anaerolineales bacterium]|nr:MAG: PQQ-dependent sugar dehydrogenase [Anaerolineales bacterium]